MNDLLSLLGRWLPVVVESVTGLLALLGLGYYCAALLAARAYAGRVRRVRAAQDAAGLTQVSADDADLRLAPQGTFHAPVSVLKPLRGVDAGMVEAFVSHCRQDYAGAYELVFGAHPDDAGGARGCAAVAGGVSGCARSRWWSARRRLVRMAR